jgi:hypothetical protein
LASNGLRGPKLLFMQGNIQKAARPRRYQYGLIAGAGGAWFQCLDHGRRC